MAWTDKEYREIAHNLPKMMANLVSSLEATVGSDDRKRELSWDDDPDDFFGMFQAGD